MEVLNLKRIAEPYNIEIIKQMYNHYLKNIKISPVTSAYIKIDDLLHNFNYPFSLNNDRFEKDDKFINESSDVLSIGKDIFENGTFWPLVISKEKNGVIEIQDGVHRASSLALMTLLDNRYKNSEIFCLIFDYEKFGMYYDHINTVVSTIKRYKDRTYFFMDTITLTVPDPDVFNNFTDFFSDALHGLKRRARRVNNDGTFLLDTNNYSEYYLVITAYALMLRNSIDHYNKNNPDNRFKGSFPLKKREVDNLGTK
jgi:hypothetical protein